MKTKILTLIICCLTLLSSCEKDGNQITVSGLTSSELTTSKENVVLTEETATSSALELTWSKSALGISDPSMGIPSSIPVMIIETSSTADFSDTIIETAPDTLAYTYSGAVLNTMGINLGFTPFVSSPMYFRIRSSLGINTEPKYSNVITVNVTCFEIDMTLGIILNADKADKDEGFRLYAPNKDGEYYGFYGASSWGHWYLLEANGTKWGNNAVSGAPFDISNASTIWNFWYPGQSGCYYTTLSASNLEWTATYIPTLSVSGDITSTMTFDKPNLKWYVSIKTTTDNAKVKVSCDVAKLYNKTTGTDDAAAVTKSIGFIPASDSTLSIDWNSASATDINIAKAGEYTLTFYLSNPKKWTYELKAGAAVVVKHISKKLYLLGIDDGIVPGDWNFNRYLRLVSEDDSTFEGVVQVKSKWGYQMTPDSGEWSNVYKMGSTAGTLAFKGTSNITAPDSGLYLIQADLKNLTYSHTLMGNQIYIGGLNDVWDFTSVVLTQTTTGVYTGSATLTKATPWGIKIYIEKDNWSNIFGGSFTSLSYMGSNIEEPKTLAWGTYAISVDLINGTCSFVLQ